MRKKNPKASFPFASSSSLNNIEELLPPMQVPTFRWWRCQECRRKIEDASAGEQPPVHSNCCTRETSSNVPSNDNATMMLSETQSLPNAQLTEGIRNVDINAPPTHQDAACDVGPIVLVIDKVGPIRDGETCVEIGNVIVAGGNNGLNEPENIDGNVREINRAFQQPAYGSSAEKTLVLAKRKDKQIMLHDGLSPRYGEQSSVKNRRKEGDMHGASENNVFRLFGTSSASGKRDDHSKISWPPQVPQKEKGQCAQITSPISKSQPFNFNVGLELSLNSFAGNIVSSGNKDKSSSSKCVREKRDFDSGQCSPLPAPEIELFRKKSQVWDLNERLARNSNNIVDRRNIFLTKEMRFQKEKTSEVEGRPQEINKRSDNIDRNRMAQGSSDGVPMEIVEFMAKNPYERGLQDAGRNSFQHGINNDMGRFAEVQGMGPIIFTKGFPALTRFSTVNARSGSTMGGAFENCNPGKSQVSISDMFPRNQEIISRGMQYPPSVMTGSQRSKIAEIGASSVVPYMQFGLDIQRLYPFQNPESQNRGKTINDIKADEIFFQRHSRQLGTGTFCIGESSGRNSGKHPIAFSGRREEDHPYLARYTSAIPYTGPTLTRSSEYSIPYLQQDLGRRSATLENGNITEEVRQQRLIPRQEQYCCVTNQNPAEFALPDSEAFTISWKDLKPPPKRKYSRGNPGDGAKRRRVAKRKEGKE